jgi:hypothetical protein
MPLAPLARSLLAYGLQSSSLTGEIEMANRNQDYSSGSRRSEQNWRDEDDRHEDANEQSGSAGRYAGYGDFGRGGYGGGRSGWSGQDQYGQNQYRQQQHGQGEQRQGGGGAQREWEDPGRGVYGQNDYRAGGYGDRTDNDRERSNYSPGGASRGPGGGYGYGYSGEGQQYGSRQQYGSQGSTGPHRGKGPKGYQRSDERIKELISERLRDDPEIDPSEVTINVQAGKVTLEGTVDSRQAKNAIEEIAEQFGSEDVQNNLRVQRAGQQQSGEAQGKRASDDMAWKTKQH